MSFDFYVDIEDSNGNKVGGGPLASVTDWQYTARFDRAGSISFTFAANDPQASQITNRRIARAYARLNGTWVEVGAGRIDTVETVPGNDGRVSLRASGLDLIAELGDRSVGNLEVGSGSGATHSAALTAIGALAPNGWTFTPANSPDNDYIYARYGGESVLGALVYLAERTQTHFYRSTGRELVFTSDFADSGIRAIQARGDLVEETCAIVSLRRTVDTHDLLTRITPYGSGQGAARLTLAATSRNAPAGYTLSAANNYIEADAAKLTYGLVDHPEVEFKEITPISNTDADLQAAADMLFDAALEELKRRSTLADQETYSLTIAGCSKLLRPMQTIRVAYRSAAQNVHIDRDLYILETTWEIDQSGIKTSRLVVSTDDRWPESDASAAAERAIQGRIFQAHPQINANAYVTSYNKNVDEDYTANFRFRFGAEVVNLQQVLFEFQILPFETPVKSIGSDSATTSSGGGTTATSSSGGSETATTAGGGGTTVSSASGGSATPTSSSGGSTTPTTSSGGSSTPTSSNGGSSTATTAGGGGATTPSESYTLIDASNRDTGATDIASELTSGVFGAPGSYSDAHTHIFDVPSHTHTTSLTNHYHAVILDNHTHTVTINAHTHTVSIAAHTHTVSISAHTHTITISDHTHGVTLSNHTHTVSISAHTHTLTIADHTHTVSPAISAVYGIQRADSEDTYIITDLDFQVNGGGWLDMEDYATDAGDGWYALDLTSLVVNATTFRPNQANNLLEVRSLTVDKTAQIDAQLSVRNTIQAIAYV